MMRCVLIKIMKIVREKLEMGINNVARNKDST